MIGKTISHYKITDKLGAGGMGEVYRAEDTTLKRQVALKILPEVFAEDPERLARFQREAEVLASLNHPNIASIYGLEEANGKRFLVLELVEGETLAERIKKGPLPVDEALEVCRQIAEGLESAHEKGVIHRDLKPANVKITPEGKVKVLDFGLAKAFHDQPAVTDASHSPTITEDMTREGVILGTAAYMSPEQAKGKPVDKRADIWAFGCLLYECLTGKKAYEGETITETLASVLKGEPNWDLLPGTTPPIVRALLQRCLKKDRKRRQQDILDARIEMEEVSFSPIATGTVAAAAAEKTNWRLNFPLMLVVAVIAAGVTGLIVWNLRRSQEPSATRTYINVEPASQLGYGPLDGTGQDGISGTALVLSPDGDNLVYSAIGEHGPQLFLRKMDDFASTPIAGTEGGANPCLSPDGEWVAFMADGMLKKVPILGGTPITLCEHPRSNFGASWGINETIVFSVAVGLRKVPATGGESERLTTAQRDKNERFHLLPHMLPVKDALLFTIQTSVNRWDNPQIALLSLSTGEYRILIEQGADARYVPTGHIVFVRRGTLYAIGFDLNQLQVHGAPVPIPIHVMQAMNATNAAWNTFAGQFSVSNTGSLAYATGGAFPDPVRSLVWLDFKGKEQPLTSQNAAYNAPRLSPDGKLITYATHGKLRDIHIYDIERGNSWPLKRGGYNRFPIWHPDCRHVTYDVLEGVSDGRIMHTPVDGSSEPEQLLSSVYALAACSWHPDGKHLAVTELNAKTSQDVFVLNIEDSKRVDIACTKFFESHSEFSPDGQWIAYRSNKSGRFEIWLQPFPPTGREIMISRNGGHFPFWLKDSDVLGYVAEDGIWSVDMNTKSKSPMGQPKRLALPERFGEYIFASLPSRSFDISRNGLRVLVPKIIHQQLKPITQINLIQNWFEELNQLVPTGN